MVYVKRLLAILCLLSLYGCSTLGVRPKAFEEGYRTGVRENMADFAKNFHGNDFPYFYWESPIVQDVRIPSRIENGVFIPEHNEPVMIEPGEWREKFSYPISSRKKRVESDKKEKEGDYAFTNVSFSASDITSLPRSFTCAEPGRKDKDPR